MKEVLDFLPLSCSTGKGQVTRAAVKKSARNSLLPTQICSEYMCMNVHVQCMIMPQVYLNLADLQMSWRTTSACGARNETQPFTSPAHLNEGENEGKLLLRYYLRPLGSSLTTCKCVLYMIKYLRCT